MIRRHWSILAILALFLLLGTTYSIVNPLFESPDEVWHYEYVRWLVEGHGLPRPEQVGEAPWHQEGSQPPLYYLAAALPTWSIPTDNAGEVIRYNPHAAIGQPDSFGNKNVILHGLAGAWSTSAGNGQGWRGVALAAHLARLFSVALGAITVLATYATAQAIFPGWRVVATLAAALVAFNPQFLFLSAAVNNDNLVIAASAAGVWLMVSLLGRQESASPAGDLEPVPAAPTAWQLVVLGALVGVAALTKLSGLALAGLAGLTLALIALRRGSLRQLVGDGLVVSLVALAVAGWWYGRNWLLYGDPLGLQAMFDILPRRAAPPTGNELIARAQGVWRSAWAVFGWFNVTVPSWVYAFYTAIALAGAAGLALAWPLRWLARKPGGAGLGEPASLPQANRNEQAGGHGLPSAAGAEAAANPGASHEALPWRQHWSSAQHLQLLLLLIWSLVVLLALLGWAQMRYPQGRLLFPAISSAAVLIAVGLGSWMPRRLAPTLSAILVAMLIGLATVAPFRWIAPAYAPPDVLALDAVVPNPSAANFDQGIRLVGYQLEADQLSPGDTLFLTLFWQALRPQQQDYSVFIHLVDETGILQAQRDSHPAAGNFPTGQWPTDAIIPDRHAVTIGETVPTPLRLQVDVGLYDYTSGERLPVQGQDHQTIGYVNLQPRPGADLPNPVSINFDDQIALVGFDFDRRTMEPGETLNLSLWWEALAQPEQDYVVFSHLVLPPDAVWAGVDQMPQAGQLPTSSWRPGQRIQDQHQLTLPEEAPPGVYFVEIGLYDPETRDRLPVNFSDKGIVLGQVKVEVANQ